MGTLFSYLPSLFSVLLAAYPASAQGVAKAEGPTPTIKVDVSLVNLTATVIDGAGRPVAALQKDDFAIYENGVPQTIAVFRNDEDIPVSVGIVFDTSGSMVDKIEDVGDAVVHFIDIVNPQDDIFVMRFSTETSLVQDFTADRRRLRQAVERLRARGSTSLYEAIVESLEHIQSGRNQRKALLVITDGNDTSSQIGLKQAVDLAIRSEVTIYCLGLGHGEQGSFDHLEGLFKDTVDADALLAFSDATGGKTFILAGPHEKRGVDQIDRAVLDVAAELRRQYTLAYYPSTARTAGGYSRIRVEVKKGNLSVRTREGYFASPTPSVSVHP
jgi:VWFA-related protein